MKREVENTRKLEKKHGKLENTKYLIFDSCSIFIKPKTLLSW